MKIPGPNEQWINKHRQAGRGKPFVINFTRPAGGPAARQIAARERLLAGSGLSIPLSIREIREIRGSRSGPPQVSWKRSQPRMAGKAIF